jgi:predicted RNase H-like HicB family nuclease
LLKLEVPPVELQIVFGQGEDGRWIAEIESLPGVLAYGAT